MLKVLKFGSTYSTLNAKDQRFGRHSIHNGQWLFRETALVSGINTKVVFTTQQASDFFPPQLTAITHSSFSTLAITRCLKPKK